MNIDREIQQLEAATQRLIRQAGAIVKGDLPGAAAFRQSLIDFALGNSFLSPGGGRILKNTKRLLIFTFPRNPHVKQIVCVFVPNGRGSIAIENVDGVSGYDWPDPENRRNYGDGRPRSAFGEIKFDSFEYLVEYPRFGSLKSKIEDVIDGLRIELRMVRRLPDQAPQMPSSAPSPPSPPERSQGTIWSVAQTDPDGYVDHIEHFRSKSEAIEHARDIGEAYVVEGTQLWNKRPGKIEESLREAPYKYYR
jgi:hypothetical protein